MLGAGLRCNHSTSRHRLNLLLLVGRTRKDV